MHYIITLSLLTTFGFGEFNYHLNSHNITPDIKCFFGLQAEPSAINGANVINTCYIKTEEGYVIIDSGPTYHYAQQAYKVMQTEQSLPIKYVINTSSNELNSLGNQFYKEQGAILIGVESHKSTLKKRQEISLKDKISKGAFENTRITPLDLSLTKDKTLFLGTNKIEIKKFDDQLIIYAPHSKTIFVGDFIFNAPSKGETEHNSNKNWAKIFKKIEHLSWDYIISSHGINIDRYALAETQEYIKLSHEKPTHLIKKKVFLIKRENRALKHTPCIQYTNLKQAQKSALKEHKFVMIKVEADNCNPCKKLNELLKTNNQIKKMVNQHIKAVKINRDHDNVPANYAVIVAPTILLVKPESNRILVKLEGSETFEDLEDSLKLFVNGSDKLALQ